MTSTGKKTIAIFCLLAFTLSIDYSLGLISAQAYWLKNGGAAHLSGLLFGIYDGSTIVITPILALLLGNKVISYKTIFQGGLFINLVGNLFYALAELLRNHWMILIGRGISGMGSAVLPLLMIYIAEFFTPEDQISAIGYIKYITATSRILGPAIGSLLTISGDRLVGLIGEIFNIFTLVGWIPIVLDALTILLVLLYFDEVQDNSINEMQDNSNNSTYITSTSPETGEKKLIFTKFYPIHLIGFASTFIYWLFMGNAFIIATYHFHIIDNEHQLAKIYMTGFGGFILSFILFLLFKQKIASTAGLIISLLLLAGSSYMYIPDENLLFYFAVGFTTFSYGLMIPSLNIFNNNLGKKYKDKLGKFMAFSISLLTVAQSVARFLGPPAFDIVVSIPPPSPDCNLKDKENYITKNCHIQWYLESTTSYVSTASLIMIIAFIILVRELNKRENYQIIP